MASSSPAGFKPFYRSSQGVNWHRRNNGDGTTSYAATHDVTNILESNKAQQNHNDGWFTDEKWGRRCASIPLVLWMKWLNEEGWDAFKPEYSDKLKQKLNDPEYRHLRTALWSM